ncbi:hypothetical protein Y032_0074g861 [Ancylostoma ceylanicum]|uniref:Uncharacterized protein n=1 Tax=Ancylostoma ceylanicum TaxID=53326 RepID=A0A016TWJ1_9BILA|nr:hypothetical protein Y032_0074g861 [Ancylostoma ceylanicum]
MAQEDKIKLASITTQGVPMGRICLQLRPQSYRLVNRLVRLETVVKHLNGRGHTTGVKNMSNQPTVWPIPLRS